MSDPEQEKESKQTLNESRPPQQTNADTHSPINGNVYDDATDTNPKSEHNDDDDDNANDVSASASSSPSLQFAKHETELRKVEKELSRLLDHSHELTAKLRERLKSKNKTKNRSNKSEKHRNNSIMTEALENVMLAHDQETESDIITHFETDQQPSSITGRMYAYQIEALNWMIQLFELNRNQCFINGILADDMGLGKTLETISLLSYLKQYRNIHGPHIVIVPLSTAQNWINEFTKWNPTINVFLFHGDQLQRQQLIKSKLPELQTGAMDVLVTSYEMAMIEKSALNKIRWEYLVIDEAHRIKNDESKLSRIVRLLSTKYRLLLTGTPLQNNMKELWSLLNFLSPQIFTNCDLFTQQFSNYNLQRNPEIVRKLHSIIRPFMLRRLKRDVLKEIPPKTEICLYCGMSALQKKWYKNVLARNLDEINRKAKSKTRLLNILMQLRKVCNHPYLFEGAEHGPPFVEGAHLYENCGKLSLLHKLLKKLFAQHSRVLIFSQMTRMLDILEDYMVWMQYKYCRIDGSTKQTDRNQFMEDFNRSGSEKQVFLLSTRAGGLGINLQTADIVILYDSDWNPQCDIQAQDRAHRIGQTKAVYVYRLITEHSVEEKILDRCLRKLYLNAVVVRKGGMLQQSTQDMKEKSDSLRNMVRFGAEYILRTTQSTISDQDIEELIQIGTQRTEQTKSNITKAFDHNVMDFKMSLDDEHNYQKYEGTDYSNNNNKSSFEEVLVIPHGPRQRNLNVTYKEDAYFKRLMKNHNKAASAMNTDGASAKQRQCKVFKVALHSKYKYDFQFVTDLDRLHELEKKEFDGKEECRVQLWRAKRQFKKECIERKERIRRNKLIEAQKRIKLRRDMLKNGEDTRALSVDPDAEDEAIDETKEWNEKKREIEENIASLSKKEANEMKRLTKYAVVGWNSKDFNQFMKGLVQYGRENVEKIAARMENKTLEEVAAYHTLFWKRYKKLNNWKKLMHRIEDAQNKREENERFMEVLNKKMRGCKKNQKKGGLRGLTLVYKMKDEKEIKVQNGYTMALDRFILCKVAQHGLDSWDMIRNEILKCKLFWNQWRIRSKTENEIKNRAVKLLKLLHLSDVCDATKKKKGKKKRKRKKKRMESENESASRSPSRSGSVTSVCSVLSNASRKRLSKKYVEDLVAALKPNTAIEIYDEAEGEWSRCEVVRYCEKDRFCLRNLQVAIDKTEFEQSFKVLEWRMAPMDQDVDIVMNSKKKKKNKKKRKRMDESKTMSTSAAKRRKLK